MHIVFPRAVYRTSEASLQLLESCSSSHKPGTKMWGHKGHRHHCLDFHSAQDSVLDHIILGYVALHGDIRLKTDFIKLYWSHLFCIIAHHSVIGEYGPASLLKIIFAQCFFFFVMKMRGACHPKLGSDVRLVPIELFRSQLYSMLWSALPKKWLVKINKVNVSQSGK